MKLDIIPVRWTDEGVEMLDQRLLPTEEKWLTYRDYNGVAADPANSRVVWFYSEFASAVNTWSTWVGSAFF